MTSKEKQGFFLLCVTSKEKLGFFLLCGTSKGGGGSFGLSSSDTLRAPLLHGDIVTCCVAVSADDL